MLGETCYRVKQSRKKRWRRGEKDVMLEATTLVLLGIREDPDEENFGVERLLNFAFIASEKGRIIDAWRGIRGPKKQQREGVLGAASGGGASCPEVAHQGWREGDSLGETTCRKEDVKQKWPNHKAA